MVEADVTLAVVEDMTVGLAAVNVVIRLSITPL